MCLAFIENIFGSLSFFKTLNVVKNNFNIIHIYYVFKLGILQ